MISILTSFAFAFAILWTFFTFTHFTITLFRLFTFDYCFFKILTINPRILRLWILFWIFQEDIIAAVCIWRRTVYTINKSHCIFINYIWINFRWIAFRGWCYFWRRRTSTLGRVYGRKVSNNALHFWIYQIFSFTNTLSWL